MDVFISYASADREHAARLAGRLTRAGYDVWWDRTIPPGRVFDEVIQEAIEASRCMIVLWSRESVKSNWVKAEAAEGAGRNRLVPVLIEDVLPPIEFKRIQAANLTRWEGNADDLHYQQLEQAVARHVRGEAGPGTALPPHREPPSRPGTPWLKAFGVGVATALVAVAAIGVLWQRGNHAPIPDSSPPRDVADVTRPAARPADPPPAPAPIPATPIATGTRDNLLAAELGGHLVVASSEGWNKLVDGNPDTYGWADQGYGVFAFRDERPATLDGVAVFIAATDDNNVREFELLASDESPSGPFRRIGRFTTQNVRVMRDPWQAFDFPSVTTRYVKLAGMTSHVGGQSVFVNELRLFGRLDAAPAAGRKD